uniref:Uncharacterized protein n=1 Tax=Arundo donax TaxID=35708 RepID=A0A0A9B8H2_ARUDO
MVFLFLIMLLVEQDPSTTPLKKRKNQMFSALPTSSILTL